MPGIVVRTRNTRRTSYPRSLLHEASFLDLGTKIVTNLKNKQTIKFNLIIWFLGKKNQTKLHEKLWGQF